ncbi:MAG: hypothetical protein MJE77_23200 [Proteobacteria bacterium]|nr:hypothetical protein [Pseudomonadota bacterium]
MPRGLAHGPDDRDGYFYRWLPYHLSRARRTDELSQLLGDYEWLHGKLRAAGVAELIADFELAAGDDRLDRLRNALRLSSHVLARDVTQLPGQLIGRLGHFGNADRAMAVVAQARAESRFVWLAPVRPTLAPPGGALIQTLSGHSDGVMAVAVLAGGKQAISASWDRTLRLWDLASGQAIRTMHGHSGPVTAVAVPDGGQQAISASWDRTLTLWDLASGQAIRTMHGHSGPVTAVAVLDGAELAISASSDRTLKLWDLASGQAVRTLQGHSKTVVAVAVLSGREQAISASWDRTLKLWDLTSDEVDHTGRGHAPSEMAVAVLEGAESTISASNDQTRELWDLASTLAVNGHAGWVNAVSLLEDEKQAISASDDHTLKLWDLSSGCNRARIERGMWHCRHRCSARSSPGGTGYIAAEILSYLWSAPNCRILLCRHGSSFCRP